VRVWTLQKKKFVLKTTYRVPVGPGNSGAVNAVALSPDGRRVAMAGRAPIRGEAGFRFDGVMFDTAALSAEQNLDVGTIYVADTANPAGGIVLRGHRGEVRALTFAPASKGKPPLLVSAATERDGTRRFGGLRLWDVATGKVVAECPDLPAMVARPGLGIRPGLAVWNTGPEMSQVRVAVAWPEEDDKKPSYLRLWDTSPGVDPLRGWEDDRFTQTVALLGQNDGATLLTGGYASRSRSGRLRVWHLSAGPKIRAEWGAEVLFPASDSVVFRPVSLAAVSAPGGPPSHVAVILQPSGDGDFHLALVDLRTNHVVDVPLAGSDRNQLPAIAARGGRLAVAATRDHAVRLYRVADLLQRKTEPEDVLTGDGLSLRGVAFVDKGRGLWLSENKQAQPLSAGLLFDLDKRELHANDRTDLRSDAPEGSECSFSVDVNKKSLTVWQGQTKLPPVHLRNKDDAVTALALRPTAPGRPGVLAVAYTERATNRVLIMLCDLADGKPYRLLVSHLQDVRQLAFSASRPLLASVADDQTVCVWSLVDLGRAVGQIPGLEVSDGDGKKVVVRGVQPGSDAAKAGLAAGDIVEKVGAPGGAAKPPKNAVDFWWAVAVRPPGDQVEVTVAGKGAVKLPVERGMDERKPLFSLFLMRTPKQTEWIGWSPAGPYDYSSSTAEEHLGWQTNTGDPAAPVSYVAAREYRKDYYHEGILRYLATEGELGRALKKLNEDTLRPPPPPVIRPLPPQGAAPLGRGNQYLVRQRVTGLRVAISADYALDDKHVLRWRLTRSDGSKVKANDTAISGQAPRDGKEWQVDLSGVDWRRGDYQMRLALHAHADGPELTSETVIFSFKPPAPGVALRMEDKPVVTTERDPLKVKKDELELQLVLQAQKGQAVEVQFAQFCNGEPQKSTPAKSIKVDTDTFQQKFKLQDGLNHLVVRAINTGALNGHDDEEAAVAEVWVRYKVPNELPPRFTVLWLEPEPEVMRLSGKDVWVVDRADVRLNAKVEAAGVLDLLAWSSGGGDRQPVLPAQPVQETAVVANLKLKVDELTPVRLWAKSKFSPEKRAERWVVFYPPLPTIAINPLGSPDVLTQKFPLAGTFRAATEDRFDVRFRITSQEGEVKLLTP
jgi:WD40 repeat protein